MINILQRSRVLLPKRFSGQQVLFAARGGRSLSTVSKLIDDYDTFVIGDQLLKRSDEGSLNELVHAIDQNGLFLRVFSETDTKTRNEIAEELNNELNLQRAIIPEQIYTSASISARYLKEKHSEVKKVYVVGGNTLSEELCELGIEATGAQYVDEHLGKQPITMDLFNDYPIDQDVGAVLVGQDNDFTYTKLCLAALYVQKCSEKESLPFLCTNLIPNYSLENGRVYPGTASFVDAIQLCLNNEDGDQETKKPKVVGIPSLNGFKMIYNDSPSKKIAWILTSEQQKSEFYSEGFQWVQTQAFQRIES